MKGALSVFIKKNYVLNDSESCLPLDYSFLRDEHFNMKKCEDIFSYVKLLIIQCVRDANKYHILIEMCIINYYKLRWLSSISFIVGSDHCSNLC